MIAHPVQVIFDNDDSGMCYDMRLSEVRRPATAPALFEFGQRVRVRADTKFRLHDGEKAFIVSGPDDDGEFFVCIEGGGLAHFAKDQVFPI